MAVNLFEDQEAGLTRIRSLLAQGYQRIMFTGPMGFGKTHVAAKMMETAAEKGKRAVFMADRIALVEQASLRLTEAGVLHGIAQGENTIGRTQPIQVCSAQTVEKRGWLPDTDLIIVDEAHILRQKTIEFLMSLDVPVVGLSATPFTVGLGQVYDAIVNVATTNELLAVGRLSPLQVYVGEQIDMTGAPLNSNKEYSDSTVSERLKPIIGDVVTEWVSRGNQVFGRPPRTLLFAPSVPDGEELCERFNALGYPFEQVSYLDRDKDERRKKIERFNKGQTIGLVSCEALGRGADFPFVECLVLARTYWSSVMAHLQQLGRGMRAYRDKDFCLVLDHTGNYLRHEQVAEGYWDEGCTRLDDNIIQRLASKGRKKTDAHEKRYCAGCGMVQQPGAQNCPACGAARAKRQGKAVSVPGQMVKWPRGSAAVVSNALEDKLGDLWPHISRYSMDKYPAEPRKARWYAGLQYQEITGRIPPADLDPSDICHEEVSDLIRKRGQDYMRKKSYREAAEKRRNQKPKPTGAMI